LTAGVSTGTPVGCKPAEGSLQCRWRTLRRMSTHVTRAAAIGRPLAAAILLTVAATQLVDGAQAAQPDPQALVQRLERDLAATARAARHHRLPSAAQARRIGRTAAQLSPGASPSCRAAIGQARRAAAAAKRARGAHGRRRAKYAKQMRAAVRRARAGIAACVPVSAPPASSPAPAGTPAPTSPPIGDPLGPAVAGELLTSDGRPFGGVPITITARTLFGGPHGSSAELSTVTAQDGTFGIDVDPSVIRAATFTAEADVPWRGGSWPRRLTAISTSDAGHLVFRADVRRVNGAGDGPTVILNDEAGCTTFDDDSPDFPVTDPGTQEITFRFEPDGPLLDGTTAEPFTLTLTGDEKRDLCGAFQPGLPLEVPAGAWWISATADSQREIGVGGVGENVYRRRARVFNQAPGEDESIRLDIAFGH
jgi:hypothetical protein